MKTKMLLFTLLISLNISGQFAVRNVGTVGQAINNNQQAGSFYGYSPSGTWQIAKSYTVIGTIVFYTFDLPGETNGQIGYGAGSSGSGGNYSFMPQCGGNDILSVSSSVSSINVRSGAGTSNSIVTFGGKDMKIFSNQRLAYTGATPINNNGYTWYQIYLPNGYSSTTGWIANINGNSLSVSTSSTSDILSAPLLYNVSSLTSTSCKINWSPKNGFSNNQATYKVYLNSTVTVTTTDTFTNLNLSPGVNYTVYVKANYNSCNGKTSNAINFSSPGNSKPAQPSNFTITQLTSESINFSWDAVSGATDYKLYECTSGNDVLKQTLNSTSTQINGLQANTQYCYKISAFNNSNGLESDKTTCACTTTLNAPNQAPSTPSNLKCVPISPNSLKLTWDQTQYATTYLIFDCNNNPISTSTTNSYTVSGLSEKTYYEYKIKAKNTIGESSFTSCAGATTKSSTTGVNVTFTINDVVYSEGMLTHSGIDGVTFDIFQNNKLVESGLSKNSGICEVELPVGSYEIKFTKYLNGIGNISTYFIGITINSNTNNLGSYRIHYNLMNQLQNAEKTNAFFTDNTSGFISEGYNVQFFRQTLYKDWSNLTGDYNIIFAKIAAVIESSRTFCEISKSQMSLLSNENIIGIELFELFSCLKIVENITLPKDWKYIKTYQKYIKTSLNSVEILLDFIDGEAVKELKTNSLNVLQCANDLDLSKCLEQYKEKLSNILIYKKVNSNRLFNGRRNNLNGIIVKIHSSNSQPNIRDIFDKSNVAIASTVAATNSIIESIQKINNIINSLELKKDVIENQLDWFKLISKNKATLYDLSGIEETINKQVDFGKLYKLIKLNIKIYSNIPSKIISNDNMKRMDEFTLYMIPRKELKKPETDKLQPTAYSNLVNTYDDLHNSLIVLDEILTSNDTLKVNSKIDTIIVTFKKFQDCFNFYNKSTVNLLLSNSDTTLAEIYENTVYPSYFEFMFNLDNIIYIGCLYENSLKDSVKSFLLEQNQMAKYYLLKMKSDVMTFDNLIPNKSSYAALNINYSGIPSEFYSNQFDIIPIEYENYGGTIAHNCILKVIKGMAWGVDTSFIFLGDIPPFSKYTETISLSANNSDSIAFIILDISADDARGDGGFVITEILDKEKSTDFTILTSEALEYIISPNPSNGSITITPNLNIEENYSVSVYDIYGNKIYESKELSGNYKFVFDTIPGIYFIHVTASHHSKSYKLILE